MGFKDKQGNSTSNFTPKAEQLEIFRSVVIQMLKEGMDVENIIAFTNDPSPQTRYGKENVSELSLAFFGGISKHSTIEDRQAILIDIENNGY